MKRKEKKYIDLGETFEENTRLKNDYYFQCKNYASYFKELLDCYNNPSYAKYCIFNKYYDMLRENTTLVIRYGISSYNSMIIVLHAIILKDNKYYYLKITPRYNYYIEIEKSDF